ncbi:unnamed protein product [Urochloa decumbens]|uniref:Subtilisin-like protease n=1 Tax=Urochloa decumbens TaxID=240449 RepID=A0ABC9EGF3_9POAL
MARLVWVACLLLAAATAVAAVVESEAEALSTYIVHVAQAHAPRSSRPSMLSSAYSSFLRDHLPEHVVRQTPRLLYSYAHAATGFAARLTEAQAVHLASQESVLAVVPDMTHQLHTTQSPSFLGLSASSGLLQASDGGANIVIGFIDSGVYPKDRASFTAPPSLPPPPSTFRGSCVSAPDFNASAYCNNKLVGAKFFKLGYEAAHGSVIEETESSSPLDTNGHGTHTASTAAGSAVVDAAFFDYARGKAVGMGSNSPPHVWQSDSTAVGAFSAIRKGIIVSASAGNYGLGESTVFNVAPWILTAGASTINRQFLANIVLGNGENFTATSIYEGTPLSTNKIPLVYGGDVGSSECEAGKLNASEVIGKIVVCDAGINSRQVKGEAVKLAGGAGAILVSSKVFGEQSVATAHVLPAAGVSFATAENIKKYIRETESPVGTIVFLGTVIGRTTRPAPRMASFSGRGPNFIAPEILKPDVTAPGVDILAAWTGENSPSGLDSDPRRVKFNIMYGTSVACAHVSGIVALLRQVHPDWSPAAIKSALMTTAYNVDSAGDIIKDMSTSKESTPFVRGGAGHVDPNRAADPGLVYNASTNDYISFLCALRYTAQQIAVLTRDGSMTDCSRRPGSVGDHNYPAFSVVFRSGGGAVTQRRVVQNVGSNTTTTYTPNVTSPAGVRVTVQPSTLKFSVLRKTQEYAVTFTPLGNVTDKYTFGSIVWSDGKYKVTSPIAITWPATQVAAM